MTIDRLPAVGFGLCRGDQLADIEALAAVLATRRTIMPAYFVYVCQEVIDREEIETYWSKIGPTLEGYQPKSLATYTPFEQLEGDPVDGVAVIEFPSFAIAKAWYDSPGYRAIRHHREAGARYIGLLVEGGTLPPALRMPHTKDRHSANRSQW